MKLFLACFFLFFFLECHAGSDELSGWRPASRWESVVEIEMSLKYFKGHLCFYSASPGVTGCSFSFRVARCNRVFL